MEKQVNKNHYNFKRYCSLDRWISYYYQLQEVIALTPSTLLEIGAGDGVFKSYITQNTSIRYKNVDIAEDLKPDVIGDIEHLPFDGSKFDVVVAFEVLEHLPFEKFEVCLEEMKRVSKNHVIISLPHFAPQARFNLKIPFIKDIKIAFKIPFLKKHIWNGQHYWEIGKRGFSSRHIRSVLKRHFMIVREFIPFENQYHHFYVLKK